MTVAAALDVLCAPRRDTLHLSSYDGLSQPEIAVRLDHGQEPRRRGRARRRAHLEAAVPPADRHDTDELVVRAALGEPLDDDERALIEGDDHLRAEVASFREVVDLARVAPEEVAPSATLDHLWDGIAAEAFGEQVATPDPAPPRRRA